MYCDYDFVWYTSTLTYLLFDVDGPVLGLSSLALTTSVSYWYYAYVVSDVS